MTILLADDHGLYRESIKQWLETLGSGYEVETASCHAEVMNALEQNNLPDLLMLDLGMPGMRGVDSVSEIHLRWPKVPLLVVSANDDPLVIRGCIKAGAAGFVSKSSDGKEMMEAIHQVLNGYGFIPQGVMESSMPKFSQKQLKILHLLAKGCSNREIADQAYLSEGTVKQYVSDILSKLKVDNRVQAGIRAREILGLNS